MNDKIKSNKPLCIGLIANGMYHVTKEYSIFPEFLQGILIGIVLVGISIGLYSINNDTNKLKEWKKNLVARLYNK